MYKWNYDSQINTASAITFSMITEGTDWVKSAKTMSYNILPNNLVVDKL